MSVHEIRMLNINTITCNFIDLYHWKFKAEGTAFSHGTVDFDFSVMGIYY
jgi:hypothetical protein